jgi:hypothetical protein
VRANDSKNAKKNESSRVRKERRKRRTTTEKNKARTNARMTYPWSLGQIQTRQLDYPSPFRFPGSRPPCYSVVRALFFWLFLSAYLRKEKGGRRSGGALGFKVSWINPKERTKKKEWETERKWKYTQFLRQNFDSARSIKPGFECPHRVKNHARKENARRIILFEFQAVGTFETSTSATTKVMMDDGWFFASHNFLKQQQQQQTTTHFIDSKLRFRAVD